MTKILSPNEKRSLALKGRPHSAEHNRKVWEAVKDNLGRGFLEAQGRLRKVPGAAIEAQKLSTTDKRVLTCSDCGRQFIGNRALHTHQSFMADPERRRAQRLRVLTATKVALKGVKPNKVELELLGILDEYSPGEWKYVGDGYTWFAGRCPDFLNVNGKKQVIELFGNYWHQDLEDEASRVYHFNQYGFACLVIWESELKDKPSLLRKIRKFTRQKEVVHNDR